MTRLRQTRTASARGSGGQSIAEVPITVRAIDGPGKGASTLVETATVLIGSSPRCDLVLQDPTVSRRHATLERLREGVRVRDLGSRNGVVYLGARVEQASLPLGAAFRVGDTTVQLLPVTTPVQSPPDDRTALGDLLGRAPSMRRLFADVERVAATELPLVIEGETGVGKELAARTLHALSQRASAAFVVFDCAAASEDFLESALFGHVRGAFTGADKAREGAAVKADGGTLFLDAACDLPLALQPKLLRLLQEGECTPVGSGQPRRLSLRIVAASQRTLEREVERGVFRRDLYFRLAGTVLRIPPLRERIEDIPLLAKHFARLHGGADVQLEAATVNTLRCHSWPGNVRELEHAVQRAVLLGKAALPVDTEEASFWGARARLIEAFERDYLSSLLAQCNGNYTAAAKSAGMSRMQLYRLLERHGLTR